MAAAFRSFFPRQRLTAVVAVAMITVLYVFTRLPALSRTESAELAARFGFVRLAMPELAGYPHKSVRSVNPSLERISAWISSVGAAVALADLDGDGLANDVCYVDPRTDLVIVTPVPGTGSRYQAFALDPSAQPYDPNTMAPMGCLAGDVNEDGLMDLLVYYWGRTPIAFLRRSSDDPSLPSAPKSSDYVARSIVPTEERWYTTAATLADLDGDGHLDAVIGNYFQDGARILDARATSLEVMHDAKSKSFNGGRNRLLLWETASAGAEPTVRFRDVEGVMDEKVARAWTLAVAAADLDGDLFPEIYFANDFGPDQLLHNRSTTGNLRFAVVRGERKLTTPASCVLGQDSFKGMGADFGDLNGDGLLDIYVSNIATTFGLQESHFVWLSTGRLEDFKKGRAPYVHGSELLGLSRSGWGWESRLADFDNDGVLEAIQATGFVKGRVDRWPELQALGTSNDQLMHDPRFWPRFRPGDDLSGHESNAFFVRGRDGRFYDIASHLALDEPMVSRGIATADVDGDGDLDFAVANQFEPSYFYRNESPRAGSFLGLHLLLPISEKQSAATETRSGHPNAGQAGRPAVGAAATVHLPDGRKLVAQVDGGNGHSGKRSSELHFGLGRLQTQAGIPVELKWRDADGRPCHEVVDLTAGWHTVYLAAQRR